MIKNSLKKIGFGLTVLAVSLILLGPAHAANHDNNSSFDLKANVKATLNNIRSLSQFSLVTGELTGISATTLPAQLTVKLDPRYQSRTITVNVDNKAIFTRHLFGNASLSELAIGDDLQIFGRYDDKGVLQALSVKDESIQLASNIAGSISALDPVAKTFTLSHRSGFSAKWLPLTVRINDNTKIVSTNGKILTFADLQMNQQVHVSGVLNTQAKTLIATQVKAKIVAPQPLPFSLQGNLTAISGTSLPATLTVEVKDILPPLKTDRQALTAEPINLVTFKVDASTKLISHSGATISLADFKIGDSLVVQGNIDAAGSITATTVRNDSLQTATKLEGSIQAIDSTAKTFVLAKADGTTVTVSVTDKTVLSVPNISAATFADLRIGYKLQAEGVLNTRTNWLVAASVTVTDIPEPLPFSLKGELLSVSGSSLPARLTVRVEDILPPLKMNARAMMGAPINEVTFLVDVNTKLIAKSEVAVSLADLTVGDTLVVQGNMDSKGEITASIVRDDSVDVLKSPLSGTVQSLKVGDQTFAFLGVEGRLYTAHVMDSTVIIVPDIKNPTFANLAVGNTVDVSGVLNLDTYLVHTSNVTVTNTSTTSTAR